VEFLRVDHVNQKVRFEVHRRVDITAVDLAGVDAEQLVCPCRRVAFHRKVAVFGTAGTEAVTSLHRVDGLTPEKN
jgi:hypothetical protein